MAIAVCLGLRHVDRLPEGLAVGLALLVAGALVARRLPPIRLLRAALALPGAWVVAVHAGVPPVRWIQSFVLLGIVVGGELVADFDERWRSEGYGAVLVAVTTLGVYATVPDTELALVLVGGAVPFVLVGWPRPLAHLGRAGSWATTALVFWVAAVDGRGRYSSIVGAGACLGLLLLEPIVRMVGGGRSPLELANRLRNAWLAPVGVAVAHLGFVAAASRVAGFQADLAPGVLVVGSELIIGLLAGFMILKMIRN